MLISTAVFFRKMDDGASPCAEFSQGSNRFFDWRSSEESVEPEKGVLDGGTCFMTKHDNFVVRALK